MNPYQILGVSNKATQDEIKNAYRGLAKKFHPDLNPGKKDLETKFKEVSGAYELIGSAGARAKYDRGELESESERQQSRDHASGQSYYQSQQNSGRYAQGFSGGGFSEEDLFESLFRGRQGPTEFAGADESYQMEIDFKESILGSEKTITLPGDRKLQVKIPAGIESGAKLRFKGQGGVGSNKKSRGDAIVEVKVQPLAGFTRIGRDVETEVPISFIEGLTGAEIKVPTLDGAVMLTVPSGVSTGTRMRIRGKGVASSANPGDQFAVLKVVLPKSIDPELSAIIKEWNGKYSYNPRSES